MPRYTDHHFNGSCHLVTIQQSGYGEGVKGVIFIGDVLNVCSLNMSQLPHSKLKTKSTLYQSFGYQTACSFSLCHRFTIHSRLPPEKSYRYRKLQTSNAPIESQALGTISFTSAESNVRIPGHRNNCIFLCPCHHYYPRSFHSRPKLLYVYVTNFLFI